MIDGLPNELSYLPFVPGNNRRSATPGCALAIVHGDPAIVTEGPADTMDSKYEK